MKIGKIILPIFVLVFAIIAFFLHKNNDVINACIKICEELKSAGIDLSRGPCLSDNNEKWNFKDWVCDVAHFPRKDVDNLVENQCKEWWDAYYSGKRKRFVEVDPECNFIRTG